MSEFVRLLVAQRPEGLSRSQLREAIEANPRFAAMLGRNPGSFVQMIARLRERGDIAEAQDRIYPTPLLDMLRQHRS